MIRVSTPPWMLVLVSAAACGAGIALEAGAQVSERFWIADQRGALALLGAGGAVLAAALAQLVRFALGRKQEVETVAGGDASGQS